MTRLAVGLIALVAFCGLAGKLLSERRADVVVSAAASLGPAIRELGERRGFSVHTAGSSVLVRQIERGAPVDLLLIASTPAADGLDVVERRAIAVNTLVVAVPAGRPSPDGLDGLVSSDFRRIGVANPRTAPLGRHSADALEGLDLAGRLVVGGDARQLTDWLVRGEVDAGLVYATDAARHADRLEVAFTVPTPVVYEGLALTEPGRVVLDTLVSEEGRALLARHGFGPPR